MYSSFPSIPFAIFLKHWTKHPELTSRCLWHSLKSFRKSTNILELYSLGSIYGLCDSQVFLKDLKHSIILILNLLHKSVPSTNILQLYLPAKIQSYLDNSIHSYYLPKFCTKFYQFSVKSLSIHNFKISLSLALHIIYFMHFQLRFVTFLNTFPATHLRSSSPAGTISVYCSNLQASFTKFYNFRTPDKSPPNYI